MTISAFEIYLIMLCDDIKGWMVMACIFSTVLCIFGGGTWLVWCTEQEHLAKRGMLLFKRSAVVLVIAALIYCAVPSSKTAIMMTSIPPVVNSALMQKDIPEGLRRLWNGLTEHGVLEKNQEAMKPVTDPVMFKNGAIMKTVTDPVMFKEGVMATDHIRENTK